MSRHKSLSTPTGRLAGAAIAAAVALGATACGGVNSDPAGLGQTSTTSSTAASSTPSASPTSTTSADKEADLAVDYRHLLLQAEHLSDDEDTFHVRSVDTNPRGMPGASAFFVNAEDDRAISDTIVLYPDEATAAETLRATTEDLPARVIGGTPQPVAVGTDGVVISGTSPEGDKAVTRLLFAEGRALVRLDFESAIGDSTSDQFVTNVAKMQLIAVQTGLQNTE